VVERDIAAGHGRVEGATGLTDTGYRLAKLKEHFGSLRIAEVETVRDRQGPRAHTGDIAGRFGHGQTSAHAGIEMHVASVAIRLHGDGAIRAAQANDGRIGLTRT